MTCNLSGREVGRGSINLRRDNELIRRCGESLIDVRTKFFKEAIRNVERFANGVDVPAWGIDVHKFYYGRYGLSRGVAFDPTGVLECVARGVVG